MKPPLVSGREAARAFERAGFRFIDQRGSHAKYRNDAKGITITLPMHQEVDRWTLKGIIRDAEMTVEEFVALL